MLMRGGLDGTRETRINTNLKMLKYQTFGEQFLNQQQVTPNRIENHCLYEYSGLFAYSFPAYYQG